jgi:hypothetical protein
MVVTAIVLQNSIFSHSIDFLYRSFKVVGRGDRIFKVLRGMKKGLAR